MTDISQGGEENNEFEYNFFNGEIQDFSVDTIGAQRAQSKIPFNEADRFVELIAHIGVFAKNVSINFFQNNTVIVGDDDGFDSKDYNSWKNKCKSSQRGINEHGHGCRTSIEHFLKNDNTIVIKLK